MEPDKDAIIKLVQDILEDRKLAGLTAEEKAVLVFDDVVNPLFKELEAHFTLLAYNLGVNGAGGPN